MFISPYPHLTRITKLLWIAAKANPMDSCMMAPCDSQSKGALPMKRLFFSMTVLLAILLAEQDAVADVLFPPYNNSVAVWLLDEGSGTSFYDATINNNNGAFVRTGTDVSFDTTVKKFGASSFKEFNAFSGEGGIVPDSASLHALTNNFTVESWIRWDGVSANGTMMSRADSTRTSAYQWEIVQNGTTKDLVLAINSAAGTILVDDGAPFPSNVFVHVAFTYASGAVNLYTNGFLAGSASNPSVVPSGIGKIALGTFIDGSGGVGQ